jgi:hypothetical protein
MKPADRRAEQRAAAQNGRAPQRSVRKRKTFARHHAKTLLHVVVPRHSGQLAPKTIKSIIVQAEMTFEEFAALL